MMKKYFELRLWRNKDVFETKTPIFSIKIPCLGGDAYSKDIGQLFSKNTNRRP